MVNKYSDEGQGREYYIGKQCYECMNCGTLVEHKWEDDNRCSCEMEDD